MKNKLNIIFLGILFLCICLIYSCYRKSKFQGFTITDNGLYYKIQSIGDGKRKPQPGEHLQLFITYKTENDSVFSDTYSTNETGKVILPYRHSSFVGSFEEGLMEMSEGDSVSFIVNADSLFTKFFKSELPMFLNTDGYVKLDVKLHQILTPRQYELEMEKYATMIEDRDIEEQRKLQTFLDTSKTSYFPLNNGMYYLPIKAGVGDNCENGNVIKLNYKGYFLNGKKFESTYERGFPLEFVLGTKQQVIRGIELAIRNMNEGSKTKFIIPSRLAFGETGSSTGVVAPFSTVVYEIEVVSVDKYAN